MRRHVLMILAIAIVGCGRRGDATAEIARAPTHSGDVWETDRTDDRATAPAAVLAFVNGLHVMVLDGGDVYAGTTRLSTTADSGGRRVTLSNGLGASLHYIVDSDYIRRSGNALENIRLVLTLVDAAWASTAGK